MTDNTSQQKVKSFVHKIPNPVGRPFKIKSATELWEKFKDYCDDVESNPWQIKSGSNSIASSKDKQSNSMHQEVRVMPRAYTLYGFCAFCGIVQKWADFKRGNMKRKGFEAVKMQIENVVASQQLDGALIHQFDSNIVARLNGLADKHIQEVTGKDGEEFKFPKLSLDDINELKNINGL